MPAPSATLYIGTHCPHCPAVLDALAKLVKQGLIGQLTAINIEAQPEMAAQEGVRSVPFLKLGPFELEGQYTPAELEDWARKAATPAGLRDYLTLLVTEGKLPKALRFIRNKPHALKSLLSLFGDPDAALTERLGASALLEDLASEPIIETGLDQLTGLTRHDDARIRADSCYILGLTHRQDSLPAIQACLQDPVADVRETAADAMEELEHQG